MRRLLLVWLSRLGMNHYKLVFWSAGMIIAATAALFIISPPEIRSDILDLLPTNDPVVNDFRMATRDFKSLDYLFVLLQSDDPKAFPASSFDEYADGFAAELRKLPDVDGVEYRIQDYEGMVKAMLPYTLLYLNEEDLSDVSDRFTDASISSQVARNRGLLTNPASFLTKDLVQYDPFGLLPVLKKHFLGKTRKLKVDISEGYYISEDGSSLLMIVRPKKPAQNIPFGKKLMADVRRIEARLGQQFSGEIEGFGHLKVLYGGGYPIAQSDANLIKQDAVLNTLSSLILVLGIYIWAFRRKSSLVYGWVPLFFGIFITFGLIHLLGVTINSATAGLGALLIGMGIDFSTVLYGRYIEERNRGESVEASIKSIMGNSARGVMTGAVTTAMTFCAMIFTHFPGMRQVGILTAIGIMACAMSVFILLPAMLYYHHIHKTTRGQEPVFVMHALGFDKLGIFAFRHPKITLWISIPLTAAMLYAATGIRLEDSIQELRSKSNEGITNSYKVADLFGASLTYMMVVVDGKTPDEIASKSNAVVNSVQPFVSKGDVLFTDAISTYLPQRAEQLKVIERVKSESVGAFSYDRIRATFTAECLKEGFDPAYFEPYLGVLKTMLDPGSPVAYEDLATGQMAGILEKYIVKKGDSHYRGVVYLYIPDDYKRSEPDGLVGAVKAVVPDAKVVGINMLSKVLRNQIKEDAKVAFVIGLVLVILIIAFDFRSLWYSLLSLVPLAAGSIWMIGTMRILGQSLNMMNIFVTTMIIGIGSDYGVHLVHRYKEDDGHDMLRVINECGKPIVIAALTTVAGFGSMSISSYPGLRSMGYVSLLGTFFCMVATLTILVAVLTLTEKRNSDQGVQ